MIIQSNLQAKDYLPALRGQIDNRITFGQEHLSGFVLGSVFSVTYHSGYEYDRRYSNPKNSAIGYVRETENGCEAHFLHTTGLLYPFGYLLMMLGTAAFYFCFVLANHAPEMLAAPIILGFTFLFPLLPILVSAVFESFTDRSLDGAATLFRIMRDPKDTLF